MIHFKIVQKDRKSIIIEYFDSKMNIIKNNTNIMTNHYIAKPELGSESKSSFIRYEKVKNELSRHLNLDTKKHSKF